MDPLRKEEDVASVSGRATLQDAAMDAVFGFIATSPASVLQSTHAKKSEIYVNEKALESTPETSQFDGDSSYVYEKENMVRDETGRIVVETSELAITALHVDDDPSLSPWTFRTFFLGAGLSCFGAVLATIYIFKPQTVSVSVIFLALISYVLGEAMALFIPRRGILKWLNPFPFNQKEHVAILIMSSSAAGAALCTEVIAAQKLYYPNQPGQAVSIFLIFSSQLLGYGFAGLLRKTLVYPKAMLFPTALPISTLFQTLHRDKKETKLRLKFFYIIAAAIFCWEFMPEYIMPILVGINIFCLAKRDSLKFTNFFGGANGNEGLGVFGICLDWQYIGSSCLYMPPLTLLTGFVGYCGCAILFMAIYYTNTLRAQSFPFLSQLLYTDQSNFTDYEQYNQTQILNAASELDPAALAQYGLPWFAATYATSLLTSNLSTTATITYMVLNHIGDFKSIYNSFRNSFVPSLLRPTSWHWKFWDGMEEKPDKNDPDLDPHYKLMLEYDEVPSWWYATVMILSFTSGLVCIYLAESTLPWYAYVISILLSFVFTLFMGIQFARYGMYVGQQNLIQMVGAFINPGKPLANMYFTLYGSNSVTQALGLLSDLKLGQYMKLPPRATFTMQILGTLIGAILNFAIMESITNSRREILLSIEGTNIWSGQVIQAYNSQAIAWGALAKELFVIGGRYQWVLLAFLLGFLVPLPQYFLKKYCPNNALSKALCLINAPILCWYLQYLCVGINSSIMVYFSIALVTQYYVRRYYPDWYMKYNFILSAGLDGGTQICVFILSWAVFGSAGVEHPFPNYWGNNFGSGHVDYCAVQAPGMSP